MALDLRPLTLAELLDRSFSVYKRHVWLFAGIMAVPAAVALMFSITFEALQFAHAAPPAEPAAIPPAEALAQVAPIAIASIAFVVVYVTIYAFALGATTIAVAHVYKDQPVSVATAYRDVRRHGLRLILVLLWAGLRVGAAWFALVMAFSIAGGIVAVIASPVLGPLFVLVGFLIATVLAGILAIRYGVAVPAVVLESLTAGQALRRSVELTEDHRGRVFLLILCAVMIAYATTLLLQGPFLLGALLAGPGTKTALAMALAGASLGALGSMFSGPIMIIGLAMIYYDLRIRKEALDLHMMLEALDASRT